MIITCRSISHILARPPREITSHNRINGPLAPPRVQVPGHTTISPHLRKLAIDRHMDFTTGDVAVRHALNFPNALIIRHTIDCTPSALEVFKEVRKCVVAVAAAWVALGALRGLFGLFRQESRG